MGLLNIDIDNINLDNNFVEDDPDSTILIYKTFDFAY